MFTLRGHWGRQSHSPGLRPRIFFEGIHPSICNPPVGLRQRLPHPPDRLSLLDFTLGMWQALRVRPPSTPAPSYPPGRGGFLPPTAWCLRLLLLFVYEKH